MQAYFERKAKGKSGRYLSFEDTILNASFAIMHTSLTVAYIYSRYRLVAANLITLQIHFIAHWLYSSH
jgi:hypothetical protein